MSDGWDRIDRQEDREIVLFLVNIKRTKLRFKNKKVKTERPEQLATSSHLLLDAELQEHGDIPGLSASVFPCEMLTSSESETRNEDHHFESQLPFLPREQKMFVPFPTFILLH
jgi:hypothetical protein